MEGRKRGGAEIVQHFGTGEVADHDAGEKLDHGADGRTLVAAKGQHGAGKGRLRVRRRIAVCIDRPAFG
ncbi:hypothetical protein D3C72_640510 [compost metagenome]